MTVASARVRLRPPSARATQGYRGTPFPPRRRRERLRGRGEQRPPSSARSQHNNRKPPAPKPKPKPSMAWREVAAARSRRAQSTVPDLSGSAPAACGKCHCPAAGGSRRTLSARREAPAAGQQREGGTHECLSVQPSASINQANRQPDNQQIPSGHKQAGRRTWAGATQQQTTKASAQPERPSAHAGRPCASTCTRDCMCSLHMCPARVFTPAQAQT